jgi:hypothetical protein
MRFDAWRELVEIDYLAATKLSGILSGYLGLKHATTMIVPAPLPDTSSLTSGEMIIREFQVHVAPPQVFAKIVFHIYADRDRAWKFDKIVIQRRSNQVTLKVSGDDPLGLYYAEEMTKDEQVALIEARPWHVRIDILRRWIQKRLHINPTE